MRAEKTLQAWNEESFAQCLREDLDAAGAEALLLQQGLSHSSYATDKVYDVLVIERREQEDGTRVVKVGIFYAGVIAGCNCADDPSPVDEVSEYCLRELHIDPYDAEVRVIAVENA